MTVVSGRSVASKLFALLETFTPDSPALTLSEMARRAGVSLSTAHLAKLVRIPD